MRVRARLAGVSAPSPDCHPVRWTARSVAISRSPEAPVTRRVTAHILSATNHPDEDVRDDHRAPSRHQRLHRPRRRHRVGPPTLLDRGRPGGLRPRRARRGHARAAPGPHLGPRPRRRLGGRHRRPARRHGRCVGRRPDRRRDRPPGDHDRHRGRVLRAHPGLRVRAEPGGPRRAALPRRARARRRAARGPRAGRRVRPARARQQLHDDPHDRLPRRRGAHGPARHPADRAVRLAGDVRRRHGARADPRAAALGEAPGVRRVPGPPRRPVGAGTAAGAPSAGTR